MNNTIIQEKVKELNDWIDFSKAGHPGYKKLTPENYRAFLTEALTSLVKEVRKEERESEADHIWSGMIRALNNQMMTYQDLYNYISLMTGVDLKKIHKKRFPNRADLKSK